MPYPWTRHVDLSLHQTIWAFIHDDNPVRIIVGPLGSGKSTGCCAEVMSRAMEQTPDEKGVRLFKCAIVRNTEPELKRTTIQTWLSMFPEDACGPLRYTTPMRHHIKIPARDFKWIDREAGTSSGEPGLDCLVEFMALDRPKDVRELLSYEGTMIWFNEVREIPRALVDMATLRVGRYPSMAQGGVEPSWYGVIADTNPPDEDHWIYRAHKGVDEYGEYLGKLLGWSFYFQPPAVLEMKQVGPDEWATVETEPFKHLVRDARHVHAGAGTLWAVNPLAENLPNLPVNLAIDRSNDPLGPGGYYAIGLSGKTRDWIICYFQGRYQYVREGQAVIPEFNESLMVVDELPVTEADLICGSDIGGNTLNPAAVFFQRAPRGVWLVHDECVGSSMGLDRFADEMAIRWAHIFPGRPCAQLWGDPAGRTRDGIFETVAFDHLLKKGWPALPAPSQDPKLRMDAIRAPMGRLIDGKPGILIHRRCAKLIKALNGAWHFKRLNVSGAERYSEAPEKSHPWSDIGDALGYGLSGAGETFAAQRGGQVDALTPSMPTPGHAGHSQATRVRPGIVTMAKTDFSPFD